MLALHLYSRSGADRVRHAYDWSECLRVSSVETDRPAAFARAWKGTVDTAIMDCELAGGFLYYARFANERQLARAIAAIERGSRFCSFGHELVVDYVLDEPSAFEDLCSELDGDLTEGSLRAASVV